MEATGGSCYYNSFCLHLFLENPHILPKYCTDADRDSQSMLLKHILRMFIPLLPLLTSLLASSMVVDLPISTVWSLLVEVVTDKEDSAEQFNANC